MKKKTLVPLIIFLLGICLISLIVYKTDAHEKEQRHITAQLNVATYGEQIKVAGEKNSPATLSFMNKGDFFV